MITARGLDKRFGRTHAVRNLSFEVRPGVVTGFLGPNGAGKSTTLRLMLDLDRGSGQTRFDGVPYAGLDQPLREVGCVLDARSFHPTRTARDHLRMLAAAAAIPVVRVDEVLDLVVIGRGRLISAGPVDEFVSRFTHTSVVVRSPEADRLSTVLRMSFVGVGVHSEAEGVLLVEGLRTEQIGDLAAKHAITLHELSVRTASLEDAFLEATGGDVEYGAPAGAAR